MMRGNHDSDHKYQAYMVCRGRPPNPCAFGKIEIGVFYGMFSEYGVFADLLKLFFLLKGVFTVYFPNETQFTIRILELLIFSKGLVRRVWPSAGHRSAPTKG